MKLEPLLKRVESIILNLMARKPQFTGQLTLQINFFEGKAKDITKEITRERIKI